MVESYNSYCRAHLARLARDTRAVNRSERMVDYSLALLNVMYPHVFFKGEDSLERGLLEGSIEY
ncbi:hypothetical protein HNQ62_003000 [Sulfurisphaera ohwakuensis]|uniref:Uncharacterized protein n=1 Tax=Sulfurisphaera ohwakuensis TaxID=69656 RepID=A0A7J9RWS2_SULOH|nr:hypothetical protein [Sulfurisphaera ohwakuensis]